MRVLVTGAAGRIGRALVTRLATDHEILGLDRVPGEQVRFVGDLRDAALLERALDGVDAVMHAAAVHAPHVGVVGDADFHAINVAATGTLARLAAAAGARGLVFTSTTALYGDASTPPGRAGWVDESLEPAPRTVYHRTKLAAERLLASIAAETGMPVTTLRMGRCFPEPADRMALYRLHRGIDARDVADAHALALERPGAGSRTLLLSGATPFLRDDVRALHDDAPAVLRLRAPALVDAFAARGWSLPASIDRVYAAARAMAALGWAPRHGFEVVLAQLERGEPEVLPPSWRR